MGEIGVLVFLAVFLVCLALIGRSRRDRLQEEITRHLRTPWSEVVKVRDVLSGLWRVSGYTPLLYDRAFSLGMLSGSAALILVLVLFRNVSPPAAAVAVLAGAVFFLGLPYLVNNILLDQKVKNFRADVEFGLETLVSVLIGTGGDLAAAVREVARVGPGEVGKEFGLVEAEINSHKPLADAFAALALRVPCPEAKDMADAVELCGTVGGAWVPALFQDIAEVVRETNYSRSKVDKEFSTMRFYAWLVGIGPVLLSVFLFLQHSWSTLLIETPQGRGAIALAGVIYVVAFGVMYFAFGSIEV